MADVESTSIPHELPSSHWLKATGQCVLERYLSATMLSLNLVLNEESSREVTPVSYVNKTLRAPAPILVK